MPLTAKGRTIKAAMRKRYGAKRGDRIFFASQNKGTIKGVDRPSIRSMHRKRGRK